MSRFALKMKFYLMIKKDYHLYIDSNYPSI